MYKIGASAWTGMTVRNIFAGSTIRCLADRFDVTVLSYYGVHLDSICPPEIAGRITYQVLQNPRWNLPGVRGAIERLVDRWGIYSLWERERLATLSIYNLRGDWEEHPYRAVIDRIGGRAVNKIRKNPNRDWLRGLAYTVPVRRQLKDIDAVFVSSINLPKDRQLIYSCKKYGIPIFALVHSWDNLTSKGELPAIPDCLMVWNEIMAQEAHEIHGVPQDRIEIVGGPQYETYRKLSQRVVRSSFMERLNINPDSKIISFAANAAWMYPGEEEVVNSIVEAISSGYFGNATLLLRLHPSHERTEFYKDKYRESKLVKLDEPDSGFAAGHTGSLGTNRQIREFVEFLIYSDVIINLASTIALDAICFDTPVICLNFNSSSDGSEWYANQNHFLVSHFRPIVDSGAVYLPTSEDELLRNILNALENNRNKSAERKDLANKMIPNLKTGEIIAETIVKFLEAKNADGS
jgi:hypothetical protein